MQAGRHVPRGDPRGFRSGTDRSVGSRRATLEPHARARGPDSPMTGGSMAARELAALILAAGQGHAAEVAPRRRCCTRSAGGRCSASRSRRPRRSAPERLPRGGRVRRRGRCRQRFAGRAEFVLQAEQRGTGHAVPLCREPLAGFDGDVLCSTATRRCCAARRSRAWPSTSAAPAPTSCCSPPRSTCPGSWCATPTGQRRADRRGAPTRRPRSSRSASATPASTCSTRSCSGSSSSASTTATRRASSTSPTIVELAVARRPARRGAARSPTPTRRSA